jgi:nicotinamide riboside kinase
MLRIGFTGIPSTGKTTTARALASLCSREMGFSNVELVSEYARKFISDFGSIDSMWDQYWILNKQLELENSVSSSVDLMITDSPIFLPFLYALDTNTGTKKDTEILNEMFSKISHNNLPRRYNVIFHLEPTLMPVDDGIRPELHFDDKWRSEANTSISFLEKNVFPSEEVITIEGDSPQDRAKKCLDYIYTLTNKEK